MCNYTNWLLCFCFDKCLRELRLQWKCKEVKCICRSRYVKPPIFWERLKLFGYCLFWVLSTLLLAKWIFNNCIEATIYFTLLLCWYKVVISLSSLHRQNYTPSSRNWLKTSKLWNIDNIHDCLVLSNLPVYN